MTSYNTVPPEKLAVYRATAYKHWQQEQAKLAKRKVCAHDVARQAAMMLKERFGATCVLLFGSLAHEQWFSASSDIDLAAWGIQDGDFYRAVAYLQDLSPEFSIDLISMEHCSPHLRKAILAEGKPL